MAKTNITSAIRRGFGYQDVWGLLLCARFLKEPDNYKWIWFETAPDDILDNKFFLDDILVCDNADHIHAYQIKRAQNPEDSWGWDELLKRGDNKASLLQKWFKSFQQSEKLSHGHFLTNRMSTKSFADCLVDGKVALEIVQNHEPEVYSLLISQLGNKEQIVDFFYNFDFGFQQPDRADIENEARQILQMELGATDEGVLSLKDKIQDECSQKQTQPLTVEKLRNWCEWDNPKPLNEKFAIPDDFELFDGPTHEQVLSDIKNPKGGIKVFVGKPGTGKSTYLSQLHQVLQKQGVVSVRHHYHISPEDPNPQERLNANRVIEAIKAAIKEYASDLGGLAHKNSASVSVREYLSELAKELHTDEKSAVFIIDGLDHVLKYGDPMELKRFLNEAILPQPGLWILIGMQAFAKDHLPQIVFDRCPEQDWIEIQGLTKNGTRQLVEKNLIGLNLPKNKEQKSELTSQLFLITSGSPLHLRYTLKQLKDKHVNQIVTSHDLDNLLPYAGDIAVYYHALWNSVSDAGKTLVILISAATFMLPERELRSVMASFEPYKSNPGTITGGLRAVAHLLKESNRGVSLYHNSFEVFVRDQADYRQQATSVKRRLLEWIEACDNEELQWSEARVLAYDLGDPGPLLALDRNWLINAISAAREAYKIALQLRLAAQAAFKEQLFAKAFELSNLNTYFQNSRDYTEEASDEIWEQAVFINKPSVARFDLSAFSTEQVRITANVAEQQGNFEVVKDAIYELSDRLSDQSYREKGEIGGHVPPVSRGLLDILPLDRQQDVARVHKYVKQFREPGWSSDLFNVYVSTLLRTGQLTKVKTLLSFDLEPTERHAIWDRCALFDLELQTDYFLEGIDNQDHDHLSNYCLLYLLLKGKGVKSVPTLPSEDQFPWIVKEYEHRREEHARLFYDNFCLGAVYGLLGKFEEVNNWISIVDGRWSLEAMSAVFSVALTASSEIKSGKAISYEALANGLANIRKLQFGQDRDVYQLQLGLQKAIGAILPLIRTLNLAVERPETIDLQAMERIVGSKFFNSGLLLDCLLDLGKPWLSDGAYQSFIACQKKAWKASITYFPDRASEYARLAKLVAIYEDSLTCYELIQIAADNLLGYGYHKDIFLFEVLESIVIGHRAGSSNSVGWIERLAPLIAHVSEYTDGDETSYLRERLASALVTIDRNLLYKYYFELAKAENFFLAEEVFRHIIRSFDFSINEEIAVATTALDESSLKELKERAEKNDAARTALEIVYDTLGNIDYAEKDTGDSPSIPEQPSAYYLTIESNELNNKLGTIETSWERNKFLLGWSKVWLAEGNVDRQTVYELLRDALAEDGLAEADGELLDIIYPLAHEFDNEAAFEYLAWAQANDSGWQTYFADKRKAKRRWHFVKDHYRQRYKEFFEKSIYRSGIRYGKGGSYFIPIPRAIEFLILFGDLDAAEQIIDASVTFSEALMADMILPLSVWPKSHAVDLVDILIQRLCWPGPLVREKAATALASLIEQAGDYNNEVYIRLIRWLEAQTLESIIAVGLLPLLKYAERLEAVCKIDLQKAVASLPATTIVIEKLIEELGRLANVHLKVPQKRHPINICPVAYQPSAFFLKYNGSFLAPIYAYRADEIRRRTGRDFVKQWAYTSEEILRELSVTEELGEAMNFYGTANRPHLMGMSTIISEVYRTAFLRTLNAFHDQGVIPDNFFLLYAYATLPVELSYWKISPDRAPDWWPQFSQKPPTDQADIDLSKLGVPEQIKAIIDKKNDYVVLGLEGAIKPTEGWQKQPLDSINKQPVDSSIILVAFGYEVVGNNIPLPEEVGRILLHQPRIKLSPQTARPFNYLESYSDQGGSEGFPIRAGDLIIYPLTARNDVLVIDVWQWFRGYHETFSLAKEFAPNATILLDQQAWHYVVDDQKVATAASWTQGITERQDASLPPSSGSYIRVDNSFLRSFLEKKQMRLGYIAKTSYNLKTYRHEEAKTVEDYDLINVSCIII